MTDSNTTTQLGSARRTHSVLLYKFNLSGGLITLVDLLTAIGLATAFGAVDTDTGVCSCSRVGTVVTLYGFDYVITGFLEHASVSGGMSASVSFFRSELVFLVWSSLSQMVLVTLPRAIVFQSYDQCQWTQLIINNCSNAFGLSFEVHSPHSVSSSERSFSCMRVVAVLAIGLLLDNTVLYGWTQ